jgi:hypothetical protein
MRRQLDSAYRREFDLKRCRKRHRSGADGVDYRFGYQRLENRGRYVERFGHQRFAGHAERPNHNRGHLQRSAVCNQRLHGNHYGDLDHGRNQIGNAAD